MKNKRRTLKELLKRLETAHEFYTCESDENRIKILNAMEHVFEELEGHGVDYSFCCLYLLYGDRFLFEEFEVSSLKDYYDNFNCGNI